MRNLLIKNAKYESWFLETYNHTVDVLERMRELDDKQMFEKDDEVGVLFEEIQSLVNSLGKNFENDEESNEKEDS